MFTYDPFGYSLHLISSPIVQYAGERRATAAGLYLLGNGRRTYCPGLKRFLSPDMLSPFANGGVNAYAYCADDPINRVDPSGQSWKWLGRFFRSKTPSGTSAGKAALPAQNEIVMKHKATSHWWTEANTPFSSTETLQTNLSTSTSSLISTGSTAANPPKPVVTASRARSMVLPKHDTSPTHPNTIGFHQSSRALKKSRETPRPNDVRDPKPAAD
ncbi:RHS repeat-associated core domain-containing protein [Pseudomonas monteilii]|uniref:RHS repeat-associated core domain-containing protein n=1 Tax=Pseudomonas monteilii TaxID=76759 RepID=UPI00383A721D